MKIVFFTIALDALPWITFHYPMFRQLDLPWEWWVMEGVGAKEGCTSWVKGIQPRLSMDGTSRYLQSLAWDYRVHLEQRELWHGKAEMVNYPLDKIGDEPVLLWEIDSDEVWTAGQVKQVHQLFHSDPDLGKMECFCRYYLGPDIIIQNRYCYGNGKPHGWKRIWRWTPGARFVTHEPPLLQPCPGRLMPREESERHGLVFDHFAYATRKQVEFKEEYYGYQNAASQWDALQKNETWPCRVSDYLKWVVDGSMAIRI